MTHLLPPLKALRAFEATARHLNFRLAAHELHVTAGAVGQQVRLLEGRIGIKLLHRRHGGMILTEQGESYRDALHDAFRRIAVATDALVPTPQGTVVKLGVRSGYELDGRNGLLSRLRRHSGLDARQRHQVRVSQPAGFTELLEGKVDVAIDCKVSRHPGYHFERIHSAEAARPNVPDYLICAEGLSSCLEFLALRDALQIGTQEGRVGGAARGAPNNPSALAIAVTTQRRRSIGG